MGKDGDRDIDLSRLGILDVKKGRVANRNDRIEFDGQSFNSTPWPSPCSPFYLVQSQAASSLDVVPGRYIQSQNLRTVDDIDSQAPCFPISGHMTCFCPGLSGPNIVPSRRPKYSCSVPLERDLDVLDLRGVRFREESRKQECLAIS